MRRSLLLSVSVFLLAAGSAVAASHSDGSRPASANVVRLVTHVPGKVLNKVGAGRIKSPGSAKQGAFEVLALHEAPLTGEGKPEVFAVDLAWCPHCAAENWSLAIALSRFGRLSGLRQIDSGTLYCKNGARPCFPHTDGLSFFSTSYRSRYLSFVPVVLQDVKGHPLESFTAQQEAIFKAVDGPEVAPLVDVGGAWGFLNGGYTPAVLAHASWTKIARSLAHPASPIAKGADGLANLFTAAICKVTDDEPAKVCRSKGVVAAGSAHLH
ncbi:MAG: DUF929 family protein [Solirubrobacteraceae bacterium]